MNPKDLAKFNPGDKAIVSFEVEFPHSPQRTDDQRMIWVYAITGKSEEGHDIACIKPISIERVRPELPGRWEYGSRTGNAILREDKHQTGGHCIVAEISKSHGLQTNCAAKLDIDEVLEVIEAVRNG